MDESNSISSADDCNALAANNYNMIATNGAFDSDSLCDEDSGSDENEESVVSDFDELCEKIRNTPEGGTLVLDKDYKYSNGSNGGSSKGIIISKPITIDGNGHTIDGNRNDMNINFSSRIFNITADNVILKNINFKNGNALGRYDNIDCGGGAIYWYGSGGQVLSCNFSNNTGFGIEDDPFDKDEEIIMEDGTVVHTIRVRPMGAKINEGGAIVWKGDNGTVSDCIFSSNSVGYPNSGGAIIWKGDGGRIINSTFYKNSGWCGGAVCWVGNNGQILSSTFFDNGFFSGDIYWFGKDGLIKNSILIKSEGDRAVLCAYEGRLKADYNFWGDTFSNPNGTIKPYNLSNWYILNSNASNPTLYKDDKLLVGFDDFLLVSRYGNVYNHSEKIAKINLDPNAKIVAKNLKKYYKSSEKFKVKVYGPYHRLAVNKYVTFKINKKTYKVKTNKKGIAVLKINQKPGKYSIIIKYGKTSLKKKITVKPTLITKNMTKKSKKAGYFNIKVLNTKGKPYAGQTVKIKFRKITSRLKTDSNGKARFKIPNNLKKGKYTIKVTYKGLTNKNTIKVK